MVWKLSDQGSLRSGTRLIRGGFERTSSAQWSSSAFSSDQRSLRSGTVWSEVPLVWDGLIRGDFERDLNLGTTSTTTNATVTITTTNNTNTTNPSPTTTSTTITNNPSPNNTPTDNTTRVEVCPKNNVRLAVNSSEKKLFHRKAPASFSVDCGEFLRFLAVKIFFHGIHRNSYKKPVQRFEPLPSACHQLRNPLRHLSLTWLIFPVNMR